MVASRHGRRELCRTNFVSDHDDSGLCMYIYPVMKNESHVRASVFQLAFVLLHSRATVITLAPVVRPPVVRPSIKPVFSEPVKHINANFGGKVPFHHISRPFFFFFFQNFAFLIFYDCFVCFVFVNIGPYGRKNFKRHLV